MSKNSDQRNIENLHEYDSITLPIISEEHANTTIHKFYLHEIENSRVGLFNIIDSIQNISSNDIIELHIASTGGYMDEAYRLINSFQNTGARIITIINPEAMSAAAYIFMIGEKRVIFETSTLMFHNYNSTVSGRGQVITSYTDHYNKLTFNLLDELVPQLTDVEINNILAGNDLYFDAYEMCRRGLATHITINDIEIPADLYVDLVNKYSLTEDESQRTPTHQTQLKTLKSILKNNPDILDEYIYDKNKEINNLKLLIELKITELKNKILL